MKHKQYIIRSTHRNSFFVAIHSFTPMFSDQSKAHRFSSREMAEDYARTELFTDDKAFEVVVAEAA